MMNNKAISTMQIIVFIFAAFLIVFLLGIYGIIFQWIDYSFTFQDLTIGQTNLTQIHHDTLGKISNAYLNSVDTLAYIVIFSLVLFMLVNAYFTRNKYPILMIIVDVILMIVYYIIAVYVSNTYYTYINSTSFLSIYIDYMPKASKLVLNLPIITSIISVIIMILSYSKLPKDENEQILEAAGY